MGLSQLWGPITLRADLRLKWGIKKSCSSRQELSKGMWHATWTQGNRVDSRLLVVDSQIANLTPGPSFGYNLCVKCPNGSCKPILDIYTPRDFQWYKEPLNPMGFDPYNCSLNIWESTGTLTPKVGAHLGVWRFIPSHSLTLPGAWNVTHRLHTWLVSSQAFALVTSLRLGLWHNPLSNISKNYCISPRLCLSIPINR
jgi:hypothetical protein